jgi:hypothetical protein
MMSAVIFSVDEVFQRRFICQLIVEVQLMMIFDCSEDERMKIVV